MGEITEVKKFSPPQEKILVKPVMRARNPLIDDPEHEAYFLFSTSTITYCLPVDRQGNLFNPFASKEEQRWLENELDVDLNYHKGKDNFWHTFKVKLGKNTRELNLSNPKHYIEYLVLKANTLFIAPNGESQNSRATYRYALVSKDFEEKESVKEMNLEMEAYMALGKIKDDKEALVNFLKVYGRKVDSVSKLSFLQSEVKKIVEKDMEGFLDIINDRGNYELKLLVAEAVECGAVIKQGRKYTLPGGDNLCGPGDTPVLTTVIEYLKSPANQDILSLITARVDAAKE